MPGLCAAKIPRMPVCKGLLNLFVRIPGSRRNAPESTTAVASPMASSTTFYLLSLHLRPSILLWRAQLILHVLLGFLLLWAVSPWIVIEPIWLVVLLLGLSVLAMSARSIAYGRLEQEGVLALTETGWCWLSGNTRSELMLSGDVVVWSGLVILPFVGRSGGRRKTLVLLPDSAAAEDLRRLRVWLLTALPRV